MPELESEESAKQQQKKKHLKRSNKKEQARINLKEFRDSILYKEMGINSELFREYFNLQRPSFMLESLINTDNKKENGLANKIRSNLKDLEEGLEEITDYQRIIEKPNKIMEIVEEITEFDKGYHKQIGQGLKILTPQQMLSRLPISLAQLKAGNNSQKLKNEVRQLLYSLYR